MAPVFILLFILASSTVDAQYTQSTIRQGASLSPVKNNSWLSNSSLYAFGFYQLDNNGYYVGIFLAVSQQKIVVWTANRDNPSISSNASLHFTSDGRLILQSQQGADIDVANPQEPATSASMLDSGNFVLYNSQGKVIWQSFDYPTNTLLQGQQLQEEKELFSNASPTNPSTGTFRLKMEENGNLVQYPVNAPLRAPYDYWASNTFGDGPNVTLQLDEDAHLYLLRGNNTTLYNLTQPYSYQGRIYLIRIDTDGIFRLYSYTLDKNFTETIMWSSTGNKCEPKGLCGLNGFCVLNDISPECECLPGFVRLDQGNLSSGCERNFTFESCKQSIGGTKYTMESTPNTDWEDDSYETVSLSTKEDCEAACLEDCRCEAVLFNTTACSKQRLPLRFGRRQPINRNMVMVKVGISVNPPSSTTTQIEFNKENKKEIRKVITIMSTSFIVLLIILSGFFTVALYRYRTWENKQIPNHATSVGEILIPKSFTYVELATMTNNFQEIIGKGACGTVFKGRTLDGEKVLAVKRLEKISVEGEKEFQTEMKIVGQTYHRNLVRLLGYCLDGPKRLLVLEYMSNGSLAEVLRSPERRPCWDERIQIAGNIAMGLRYLHEECEVQIIHCDIKPQNILMDENGLAKISDFGLSKLLQADQTKTLTGIRGTKGNVAPEWHKKLPVTVKADVYSFGIVLLEIISCRRSIDWSLSEEEAILEDWVYKCFEAGELEKLIGDEEVNKNQLEKMVKVGLWCIQEDPSLRPSMKKALIMLEGTAEIPKPPHPSFFSVV